MSYLARVYTAVFVLIWLMACATPRGPWTVRGPVDADAVQAFVAAAKEVCPDDKGWLAMGGVISFLPSVAHLCLAEAGWKPAGCSSPGKIDVLLASSLEESALAHELCHLGLERGGGCPLCGKVRGATEPEADACSLLVKKQLAQ